MVVPHPEGVELGSDAETFLRGHVADFRALDPLGILVISEDSNSSVHQRQASTVRVVGTKPAGQVRAAPTTSPRRPQRGPKRA